MGYPLKHTGDIQQDQVLGRRAYSPQLQQLSLRAQQDPGWSRAASCDSEHTKVQFFVLRLLLTQCSPQLAATAARARSCKPSYTAEGSYSSVTRTNRRGNCSSNKVRMNSRQASASYQTIPPGTSGWLL